MVLRWLLTHQTTKKRQADVLLQITICLWLLSILVSLSHVGSSQHSTYWRSMTLILRPSYVDKEELEANKDRIIKVLNDFGVQIRSIRATVGPTITLYEINACTGCKNIQNKEPWGWYCVELAAIGIRIIAPMPGKGTIGIEVPNAKPNIVSMFSILNSKKFQESNMELPIALGKTITTMCTWLTLQRYPICS